MAKPDPPLLEQIQEVWGSPIDVARIAATACVLHFRGSIHETTFLTIGVIAGSTGSPEEFVERFTKEVLNES